MANEFPKQRRLAAIMFTDMVGYSAMAQRNEAVALELLDEHRALLRESFARHGGHEIEAVGDGFFVEFASALAAVNCAAEIQRLLHERNASQSADRQTLVRIGIHLGDVVAQGERVHGDGVNIAARIEPLAGPGGVCLSEDVARQVQNKIEFEVRKLGRADLKNIDLPVQLYRLVLPWEPTLRASSDRLAFGLRRKHNRLALLFVGAFVVAGFGLSRWMTLPPGASTTGGAVVGHPDVSVAVLPFNNMSGDPKQDFFADGITEQIITELARFRDLRVISRNSTFTYKGKAVDVREVGRHMAARYVVEGSVQRRKKRLRVTAQLLDTHSGAHLWADAYDRDLDRMEVFDVQDDIVQHVVAAIADAHGAISRATFEEGKSKEPERLDAYECVLRYYGYVRVMAPAEHARVRDCLEYAVKVSPDYAEAWAGLADVYGDEYVEGFNERPEPLRRSLKAAQRAVALDPASPRAHMVLAKAHFSLGDRDALVPALERAIALNPNNAEMLAQFGVYWTYAFFDDRVKRTRGVDALRKAIALTPVHPGWYYLPIAYDLYERGEYDSALREAKKIDMPDYVWANEILVLIYGAMGRKDDARASIAKLLELYPDFPKNIRKEHRKWVTSDAIIDRYIVDLRRAGLEVPDGV